MRKLIQYLKRKKILISEKNYIRSISGNFVHPHLMAVITPKELYEMPENDFKLLLRLEI